jgi:hypothetical protein
MVAHGTPEKGASEPQARKGEPIVTGKDTQSVTRQQRSEFRCGASFGIVFETVKT